MGDEVGSKVPEDLQTWYSVACDGIEFATSHNAIKTLIERIAKDEAAIVALEGQIEKLKADAKIGDEMLEALEAKYEGCPHHPITEASVCGCSYDRIGDVCAFHAPALASAKQRVGELREVLAEIVAVASGEEQVAADDTEGMAWIDKTARAALANKE